MAERPKTWLITGCSSGFGELFVRKLRSQGENVIAAGRNASERLSHLSSTDAHILELDVTAPASEIEAKVAEAWNIYPDGIDIVVNNAGYILSGAIEELTEEEMEHAFRTNFYGPLNITKAVLPRLRAKGKGTLFYMSSQAGQHADPGAAGYCASKFALEGAVECLSKELAIFAPGIKVLIVEPGYFNTRAFANIKHVPARAPDYAEFNANVRDVEASIVGNEPGDASKAVDIMIDLVNGTGVAADKTAPFRVPLGTDGWQRVRDKGVSLVNVCDEWETVAKSTDVRSEAS
ncbi:NAD(P)-binding protein [Xylariaceae sp. FL1019]|nr:NAD(P)-binding protein [Xylariaceae sp. FL1019]